MDPASSPLGGLLAEEITPVVMVLSTILAEESCKKSGLSFVELLRPFTVFQNIDVPVRTASDLPYRLQSFRVRMVYASDVQQPDHEAVINNLKEVVTNASENTEQATGSRENSLSDLHSEPPPLEDLLSMSESEIQPLWFRTFNEGLSQAVSYSDHEAFDHPVACLLVVSPKDKLPMNTFVDLFNTNQLPPILNDGAMDPKILKHYLLLHDNQDDTVEKSAGILSEMRSTLGLQNCRLLCINSAMDETMEWKENPWAFCKTNMNCHCLLNLDDFNEIKEFMQDLTSKKIIPYMEQKIRILNQQISATRKGFKNQIKNLWWRKGKEDTSDAPDGSMYTFSSIESQIRVLGDYAFMLRDYELALSNYRLLSTDYKLDKAWKRYAGSQEMVGLSLFMLDQSRKDSEYCMENAFSTYLKLGSSGLKNATRCGIWWAEMLKAWAQHKEAASVYFRISNEEPSSHAAVLLEQSSYCYLFSNPPMLRKFGFHLVLAGNRYFISDQRKHAIRTYRIALSVYKGNTWSYINDHVHFNIGRWYAFYKMFDAAIKHMLEVLECTHQSLTTQDLFLRDFFQIVQNMGRKLEVVKLQLPSVNMSSLKVIFEDYRTYASSAAVHVKESVWQSLEENFVPPITTVKSNWLESGKLFQPKKDNDDSISVVGEAIKVHLEFKNPLQISIYISAASLVCKQSVRPATVESGECTQTKDFHNNVVQEMFSSNRDQKDDTSLFDLSEHDFVLGGGETKEVQLEVTPKTEGYLKIIGVTWTLSGHVVGCHNFDLNLKKKNKKKRAVELFPRQSMSFEPKGIRFSVI